MTDRIAAIESSTGRSTGTELAKSAKNRPAPWAEVIATNRADSPTTSKVLGVPAVGKISKNAKPPDRVAAAVERQLTRRRMRPRTLVGADARSILGMKALLSARALDAVWAQGIGG